MTPNKLRFAALYALANFGAFMCFVPLIALGLPRQMLLLSPQNHVTQLSWALLLGSLMASAANIMGGWISDRLMQRTGSRRSLIGLGLAATLLSFIGLAVAGTAETVIAAFLLFQLCFNLMFAPMAALATDHVDDGEKGRVFGLLSLALPLSQATLFLLVRAGGETMTTQLAVVAIIACVCIGPLLTMQMSAVQPRPDRPSAPGTQMPLASGFVRRDFALAWCARLLIQCAAVAMGSYLFVHLSSFAGDASSFRYVERWMGTLSLLGGAAGLVTGLSFGTMSDRLGKRRPFLMLTALFCSAGCGLLGIADNPALMAVGYAIFSVGLTGFLTIDGALVAQLVGPLPNRAAALSLLNLTNTLSGVIVPAATIVMDQSVAVPTHFLFLCVAVGALIAAMLSAMIATIR